MKQLTLVTPAHSLVDTLWLGLFLCALVGWLTLGWWGTHRALSHRQGEAGQGGGEGLAQKGLRGGHAGQLNSHTEGGKL
jgi:hypothetical protein